MSTTLGLAGAFAAPVPFAAAPFVATAGVLGVVLAVVRQGGLDALDDRLWRLDPEVVQIETAHHYRLAPSAVRTEQSSFDCTVSGRGCSPGRTTGSDRPV